MLLAGQILPGREVASDPVSASAHCIGRHYAVRDDPGLNKLIEPRKRSLGNRWAIGTFRNAAGTSARLAAKSMPDSRRLIIS